MPPLSDFYFITINRLLQYSFSPFMAPLRQNMPGRRGKTENSCLFVAEGNKKDKIAAQICLPRRAGYDIINAVKNKWPCGQAVKTEPSQGSIPGSIPGKVTTKNEQKQAFLLVFSSFYGIFICLAPILPQSIIIKNDSFLNLSSVDEGLLFFATVGFPFLNLIAAVRQRSEDFRPYSRLRPFLPAAA